MADENRPTFTQEDLAVLETGGGDAAGETKTEGAAQAAAAGEGAKEGQQPAADAGADGKAAAAAKPDAEGDVTTKVLGVDGETDDEGDGEKEPAKTEGEAKAEAKDDKKTSPEPAWTDLRARAIDREIKRVEAQLAKKLTAADLPKELAKRRGALEKTLGRYNSLEDALVAGFNAQEKIRTGAHKQPLAEDATDAEKAQWRKDNNIPEKPEGYDVPKVAGHQWTEADAPVLDALKAEAFKNNWPQDVVSGVTTFYANLLKQVEDEQATATAEMDRAGHEARRDRRRGIWGADHKQAYSVIERTLKNSELFPEPMVQALAEARLPDGSKFVNHPEFDSFLFNIGMLKFGEGAMVSGEQATASASEKAEIEALMHNDIDAYNNKPWKTSGMTAERRYYEILKKEEARKGGRAA